MSYEVFKLQRELVPGTLKFKRGGKVLVYNEGRTITGEFPTTPETDKLLNGRAKVYVVGRRLPDGRLETLPGTVDGQEW